MANSRSVFYQFAYQGFKRDFILANVVAAFVSAVVLLQALLMGEIVDSVGKEFIYVRNLFLGILLTMIIEVSFTVIMNYISGKSRIQIVRALQEKLGNKVLKMDYGRLAGRKNGDIMSLFSSDIKDCSAWTGTMFRLGMIPVKFFLAFLCCFLISWKTTICLLIVLPIVMGAGMLFSNQMYGLTKQEKEEGGRLNQYLLNVLSFLEPIKAFHLETYFVEKNNKKLWGLAGIKQKLSIRRNILKAYNDSVGFLPHMALFAVGAFFFLRGEISMGDIMIYLFLIGILSDGIGMLSGYFSERQRVYAGIDRLLEVLGEKEETGEGKTEPTLAGKEELYRFSNVSFSYAGSEAVLKDVNFEIRKGEKVLIKGESGSGKSTLFYLMCGLYPINSGQICFMGNDLETVSLEERKKNLAVCPQEFFFFPGTVKDNLIGAANADDTDALWNALECVGLREKIDSLPEQFETRVKRQGSNFSKGQKQRLCLARTLLRNKDVYLLDEPTSALDPENRKAVLTYFLNSHSDKTVIIIAHDIMDTEAFDRVIFVKDGHTETIKEPENGRKGTV